EMAHDLLESGLRIVEAEPDSVARADVHPLEELVIEDPGLLEDPALLGDIVLRLGHGAYREGLGPSSTSAQVPFVVRYVRHDYALPDLPKGRWRQRVAAG